MFVVHLYREANVWALDVPQWIREITIDLIYLKV